MAERLTIQIKDNDNVVVAVHDLPAGTKTESGVVTRGTADEIVIRDENNVDHMYHLQKFARSNQGT